MKNRNMKTHTLLASMTLALLAAGTSCSDKIENNTPALKPRIVVMTDIGPAEVEPDDNESAVRLLAYADRFEIEAIITSIGWNCDPYPEEWAIYLTQVIDAYQTDVQNLMRRSNQQGFNKIEDEQCQQELGYWPSADYIRSRAMMGSKRAGIGVIGADNDSPGSDFLIRLADEDDPRPIWLCSWGGANTFAQAVWRVKQERSAEELKKFLNKFRLYTITDQDMQYNMRMNRAYSSHQWLRRDYPFDLLMIWDESAWLNQNELGKSNWDKYASQIQGKGAMGKVYPKFLWGVEGDTPSFLNLMPNGLNNPDDPTQIGWGGCHQFEISPDEETYAWTNWQQPLKDVSNSYEQKFYPDEFNDFAARMQWADTGEGNHNPVAVVNGSQDLRPLNISAKPGQTLKFDASKSFDPDGDKLSFNWWFQEFPDETDYPAISNSESAKVSFSVPDGSKGNFYHLICEIHDDGPFSLTAYRRVIISVE
ncbi:MAG: DUF1593 domain-containing protein [Salinivirgaceae bacterium]|nr:DUF1593 domain-containing protein [Salinivirgaceae bacterium]